MTYESRPISEITQQAIDILIRELGTADTLRFINHLSTGHGNYTEDRKALFEGMSLDDIVSEIEARRQAKP